MKSLLDTIYHSWHAMRRTPIITIAIITLMALGMGGVAAIFIPTYVLIYAPLPFFQSEQLVRIGGDIPFFDIYTDSIVDKELLNPIFSNVMAYGSSGGQSYVQISSSERRQQMNIQVVTPNFFKTLGVNPQKGFCFDNDRADFRSAVISDKFWHNQLQSSEDAIGKSIIINEIPRIIVGVMPKYFSFPTGTDIWLPVGKNRISSTTIEFIGRLRPGLSIRKAAVELETKVKLQSKMVSSD